MQQKPKHQLFFLSTDIITFLSRKMHWSAETKPMRQLPSKYLADLEKRYLIVAVRHFFCVQAQVYRHPQQPTCSQKFLLSYLSRAKAPSKYQSSTQKITQKYIYLAAQCISTINKPSEVNIWLIRCYI